MGLVILAVYGGPHWCPAAEENAVSRPVGFVRVRVPANDRVLTSIPFHPFSPAITNAFRGQLIGPTNTPGTHRLVKWDPDEQVYLYATKLHGNTNRNVQNEIWLADPDAGKSSSLTIQAGESFWIENGSERSQNLYLWGDVIFDPSMTIRLEPGLNLVSYAYSTRRQLTRTNLTANAGPSDTFFAYAAGRYVAPTTEDGVTIRWAWDDANDTGPAHLEPGGGYTYHRNASNAATWTETLPYVDGFPVEGTPCILSMEVNKQGTEVSLLAACSGAAGEKLDIMYQDVDGTNEFSTMSGWRLADSAFPITRSLSADGSNTTSTLSWTDAGFGRGRVSAVSTRYYLVGRTDIDADGDGVPDARETFVYGSDPANPDTDGDRMPDGWEIRHGLDPLGDDAAGDSDKDGKSNLREYKGGTHPQFAREENRTIHVDSNVGDDSYTGFARTPLNLEKADPEAPIEGPKRTINGALGAAVPGDRVIVNEGTYREAVNVPRGICLETVGVVSIPPVEENGK